MKAVCLQENLKIGLQIARRTIASKSATLKTFPALTHILISTDQGRLRLTSTNLEMSMLVDVAARVDEAGAILVPARRMLNIITNLPNDSIDLACDGHTHTLMLTCRTTTITLQGMDPNEFPPPPSQFTSCGVLPQKVLGVVLGQVLPSVALDHTNPGLRGARLHLDGQTATIASIDGYRLAVRSFELSEPVAEPHAITIPRPALIQLARLLRTGDELIELGQTADGKYARFTTSRVAFTTELIGQKFPDYMRFIPQANATYVTLDTAELQRTIKRLVLFMENSRWPFWMEVDEGRLHLHSKIDGIGESHDALRAIITGEDAKIALDVRFMHDGLAIISTEMVRLEFRGQHAPIVMRPVGGSDLMTLIMPMRMP